MSDNEWKVIRPLYGANSSKSPLLLGPFVIDKWTARRKVLAEFNNGLHRDNATFNLLDDQYIIEVTVSAPDDKSALIIADNLFRSFESAVRYVLGYTSYRYDVGILRFKYPYQSRYLAFSRMTISEGVSLEGTIDEVDLANNHFIDTGAGHDKVWNLIMKSTLTDIEKRILRAIDWIGKAIYDHDQKDSFVQYMFAVESLLSFKESGVIIGPSIMYQIAEFAAFVIGKDLMNRKIVAKEVKDLYGIRSAIAHGGDKVIDEKTIRRAFMLCKALVMKLLTQPQYVTMKSITDLADWVEVQRYS
jgi:hypothetical protein